MVKIFHHNDLDGYSSGYLTYKYFKELGRDDIIATSMDYNSKFDLNNILSTAPLLPYVLVLLLYI